MNLTTKQMYIVVIVAAIIAFTYALQTLATLKEAQRIVQQAGQPL